MQIIRKRYFLYRHKSTKIPNKRIPGHAAPLIADWTSKDVGRGRKMALSHV